ncbi:UNVERIFIED_CONTAM: hypothetical protein HDU68_001179, partial [Siphonaria sp. JEL0065]
MQSVVDAQKASRNPGEQYEGHISLLSISEPSKVTVQLNMRFSGQAQSNTVSEKGLACAFAREMKEQFAILDCCLDKGIDHEQFWSGLLWTMQEEAISNQTKSGVKVILPIVESAKRYFGSIRKEYRDQRGVLIAVGLPKDEKRSTSGSFRTFGCQAFMACDLVYASQYCSHLRIYLDIHYDLEPYQVLALYLQQLLEVGDVSVSGINMKPSRVVGWGCTSVFSTPDYHIPNALGFIGGFGLK